VQPGDIEQRFPAWSVWRSDAGRWWATRRGGVSADILHLGGSATLDADDPESLVARLVAEEELILTGVGGSDDR
jgi:hypothetical protein